MGNSRQGRVQVRVGYAPIFAINVHRCVWTASIKKNQFYWPKYCDSGILIFIPEDGINQVGWTIMIFWALILENRAMLTHFWPKKLPIAWLTLVLVLLVQSISPPCLDLEDIWIIDCFLIRYIHSQISSGCHHGRQPKSSSFQGWLPCSLQMGYLT